MTSPKIDVALIGPPSDEQSRFALALASDNTSVVGVFPTVSAMGASLLTPDVIVAEFTVGHAQLVSDIKTLRDRPKMPPVVSLVDAASYDSSRFRGAGGACLVRPIANHELLAAVMSASRGDRYTALRRPQRILAIGAHPDDVELGVGGVLAAHARAGDQVTILAISDGAEGGDAQRRREEAHCAASLLGATLLTPGLDDALISPAPETINIIEDAIALSTPDIVYTHSSADTHQDHRGVHMATKVAARAVPGLYCYGSPSHTIEFVPVRFNDISDTLEMKLRLLDCHTSQKHRWYFDHELVVARARYWGSFGRWRYAEPLEVERETSIGHVELADRTLRSRTSSHAALPSIGSSL